MIEYIFVNPDTKNFDPHACGYEGPGWYFWDETDAFCYGPYVSPDEALQKLRAYGAKLDSGR